MADKIYLKRDTILNAEDLKTQDVSVPEWGGIVVVRAMTGIERDSYEATLYLAKGRDIVANAANARAKLVQRTVIDPDSKELMFTEGDIEVLGKKSGAALERVFLVAKRLSGLTNADLEELAANFNSAPSDSDTIN